MTPQQTQGEEMQKHSRTLLGKVIVSKEGRKFGEVGDIRFDPRTGELIDILISKPTDYCRSIVSGDKAGIFRVPFSAVISVGDFLIVSEEDIV
jgi:sporulation protein YlmC with PRC-barrel domain